MLDGTKSPFDEKLRSLSGRIIEAGSLEKELHANPEAVGGRSVLRHVLRVASQKSCSRAPTRSATMSESAFTSSQPLLSTTLWPSLSLKESELRNRRVPSTLDIDSISTK